MKRNLTSGICIIAALATVASCNKIEEKGNPAEKAGTVINAVIQGVGTPTDDKKAEMAYCYDVLWQSNDQIWVTNGADNNTFTLTGGVGTTKGQFTEDSPSKGISGNIEAFYPKTLHTGSGLEWPDVQYNNQVAPMYAKQAISGTGGELVKFSSLGAMVQIIFNSMSEGVTVTSITLSNASKPLSGPFTVSDGQAFLSGTSDNGITLTLNPGVEMGSSAKIFYLAVPAGNYSGDEVTLTIRDDVHDRTWTQTTTTFPDIQRNTVARIAFSGRLSGEVPDGALPGKFSVGPGEQVFFSKGNLYWTSPPLDCKFEANQYGLPTDYSEQVNWYTGAHGGYLHWWTDADLTTTTGTILFSNATETTPNPNFTANRQKGIWRALSKDEWTYLFNTRTNAAEKYGFATINASRTKYGVVILPDSFTLPAGLSFTPGSSKTGFNSNTYTSVSWAEMEAAGAVFLPVTGYAQSNGSSSALTNYTSTGYYWSSTKNGTTNAYYMQLTGTSVTCGNQKERTGYRYCLRLVTDCD